MKKYLAGWAERLQRSELLGTVAVLVIAVMFKIEWPEAAMIASTLGIYTYTRGKVKVEREKGSA